MEQILLEEPRFAVVDIQDVRPVAVAWDGGGPHYRWITGALKAVLSGDTCSRISTTISKIIWKAHRLFDNLVDFTTVYKVGL